MIFSPAELESLITEIANGLASHLASQPRLVDRHGLARKIGVSVPSIERAQRDKKISVIRIGRRVLYDPNQVIAELAAASELRSQHGITAADQVDVAVPDQQTGGAR